MSRNSGLWLLFAALTASAPAYAHGALGEGTSFWSGAFHLLVSPLSIAAVAGLIAALAAGRVGKSELPFLAFAISGMCGFLSARFPVHGAALAAAVGVVVVGISAASGYKAKPWLAPVLAACGGAAAGAAVELDAVTWGSASGVGAAILYFSLIGGAVLQNLQARPKFQAVTPIALRVVGAWVTAIGALLGALALRTIVA